MKKWTVRDVITTDVVTVRFRTSYHDTVAVMAANGVSAVPVVDHLGHLVGIVSRADLLTVYLRPDNAIRDDITEGVLRQVLQLDQAETQTQAQAEVTEGVATLTGNVDRKSTAQIAVHLTRAVPGVIDVVDKLSFTYDDTILTATAGLA